MRGWTADFAGFEILLLCSMDRAHVSGRSRLPAEPSPAATFATIAGRAIPPTGPGIASALALSAPAPDIASALAISAAATFPPRFASGRAPGTAAAALARAAAALARAAAALARAAAALARAAAALARAAASAPPSPQLASPFASPFAFAFAFRRRPLSSPFIVRRRLASPTGAGRADERRRWIATRDDDHDRWLCWHRDRVALDWSWVCGLPKKGLQRSQRTTQEQPYVAAGRAIGRTKVQVVSWGG
jgi:hypothetical protein